MTTINQVDLWGDYVEIEQKEQHTSLASRFVCPPFSVIDTKQAYWQERKRLWANLGIEGEIGRALLAGKGNHRTDYGEDSPTGGYAASFAKTDQDTAVSLFDPALCETLYTWFCPPSGSILDPFAGGSVRGIVAHMLGRRYTGIDLSARQIEANREQAQHIIPNSLPVWIAGDSLELPKLINGEQFDFVFSCPPYYDLEQYSDDPADLSNKPSYDCFLATYRAIIVKLARCLKPNRFACFVVGNVRGGGGAYYDLAGDTVRAFTDYGLKFYNEIVLLTSLGSLPIRAGKHFNAGRKVGKAHQNVLVFVKGDGMVAAKECEQL
jgi:DNA modification methylase